MLPIKVKKLRENAYLPTYETAAAVGADLHACIDRDIPVEPGQTYFFPTGLAMEIPVGCAGLIYARSGLSCKKGLAPANKVGVVDSDYRGEVIVALHNHSAQAVTVSPGNRIAQLVITPVFTPGFYEVSELSDTQRADAGFGSTGSK